MVVSTYGEHVLCNQQNVETSSLAPCNHEEADTRICLHVADAFCKGNRKVMIRTVDTDVLVLAVSCVQRVRYVQQVELWVAFGCGANMRYIAAHNMSNSLGLEMSRALPFFHALTGCDTVSCFSGKGKRTAWTTWQLCPDVTAGFEALSNSPDNVSDQCMATIERFVVLLYDRTSPEMQVNGARKQLFAQKGRAFDAIPPTVAALNQHIKRAAYQAGHCWGQMLNPMQQLPCLSQWGWILNDDAWEPLWKTLPEVTKICRVLIRCGCKKGCRGACSCSKANLPCTALCLCSGECDNN
jgi:hypothetical protein